MLGFWDLGFEIWDLGFEILVSCPDMSRQILKQNLN